MIVKIELCDGRTFKIGQKVTFDTKYGSRGTGTVAGFVGKTIQIKLTDIVYEEKGPLDGWPLKTGGDFDRLRDHGVYGGEIV